MELNLLDNLKQHQSICLQVSATTWEDAVYQCIKPLIDKDLVTYAYYEAIIASTLRYGPYYIIADGLAMPHAQSSTAVKANGFSLVTLKAPIYFRDDNRPVQVLVGLAATSAEIHTAQALPQIVAIFEEQKVIEAIAKATTVQEVFAIISQIDLMKYINK